MMMHQHYHAEMDEFGKYRVQSQPDSNKWYNVDSTNNDLTYNCLDHICSNSECKHIHVIKTKIMKNSFSKKFKIMNRDNFKVYKYCDSGNIIKRGTRQNKAGTIQKHQCEDCQKRFILNCGFESMRYDDTVVMGAMQMHFARMFVIDIADHYELQRIKVSHIIIHN